MSGRGGIGISRRLLLRGGSLALAGWGLAGCTALPGLGPPPNIYDLSPKSSFREDLPQVNWQLVVEEPVASNVLDTVRVALRPQPLEIKYFADSRWSDRAPKMVQTLLVESFENTGRIVGVGRQSIGLRSDYNLKSELREFQAEYLDGGSAPPTIQVRLSVKLIGQPSQEIVAAQSFDGSRRARDSDFQSVVLAFDEALNSVLRQVVEWTLTAAPPVPRRRNGG